jgi:hypothetical protein
MTVKMFEHLLRRNSFILAFAAWALLSVLLGVRPGWSQNKSDFGCTVSILNQTAFVQSDGSWTIPNIPSNMGPVRARMTCIENGQVLSGSSDFFTIETNRMSAIPPIPLGVVAPAPAKISVAAPSTTLTSLGATVQLAVTATYPDESTGNVTAASTGTVYTSTNPRVATVGPNGRVTAVGSGPVLVTALNEAVLAAVLINVSITGDTDGDGIPDDVELASGLDPNNPLDALEDLDADGLTNRQELVAFGTGIRDADSDDDSIQDGEEVVAGADGFVTNPLLTDTDGDGLRDALEIATESDPTNPGSYDLSRALQSLEVSPSSLTLTVNTIIGEASRQLTVTGHLTDGTLLDLTPPGRGTGYSSSNLTICNFGATPGRVFAGNNGACTVTATNAGFTAAAAITVRSFAPTALACLSMPGFANNVDVSGNRAYVASGSSGLVVVAVDDRQSPSIVTTLNTAGNANDVRVEGDLAYVADGSNGLLVLDVSNSASPVLLGSVDTPGDAQDVVVYGSLAYVADGASGLQIVDVTNHTAPQIVGTYALPSGQLAKGVDADQGLAALATSSGLRLLNVSTPATPVLLGQVSTGEPRDVTLNGDVAYVADYGSGFVTVDILNPAAPLVMGQIPAQNGGLLFDIGLANGFAFGADVFFVHGVPILDIRAPGTPIPRAILDFSQFEDRDGTGIALDSNFVYLTASLGIIENGTSGATQLCIGKYLEQEDDQGVPPMARITSPAGGATVIEGQLLSVSVEAIDDVAVVTVDFLVGGATVFTDSAPHYKYTLTVPAGSSTLSLGARAVDMGGLVGTAADVVLNVVPDPLTSVTGRVITEAGDPLAGATVTAIAGIASATGTTATDGTFLLDGGLPTVQGSIVVDAEAMVAGGETLAGSSTPTSPVPGGMTNVGDIMVRDIGCTSCQNVAQGKSYSLSPVPASQYPDGGGELTDGVTATGESWVNAAGWLDVTPTITLDLGQVYNLNEVQLFVGNAFGDGTFGVFRPASVTVSVSTDGVSFTNVGSLSFSAVSDVGTKEQVDLGSLVISTVGRWVRYSVEAGGPWVMVMELTVRGTGCNPCGEASCTPVMADYISHFTELNCTGEEHYYTPYFFFDGIRRSWNGMGCVGTVLRTVTNKSYKDASGTCYNAWPDGNTLTDFVRVYR